MKNKMVIIAGCGRLGALVASKLSELKRDVMVIDQDKTAFRKLDVCYGGLTITGSATDIDVLKKAGIEKASTFIALTNSDSVNIASAQMAKLVFNIPETIARVYDEDKIDLIKNYDISVICPTELSQNRLEAYVEGEKRDEHK